MRFPDKAPTKKSSLYITHSYISPAFYQKVESNLGGEYCMSISRKHDFSLNTQNKSGIWHNLSYFPKSQKYSWLCKILMYLITHRSSSGAILLCCWGFFMCKTTPRMTQEAIKTPKVLKTAISESEEHFWWPGSKNEKVWRWKTDLGFPINQLLLTNNCLCMTRVFHLLPWLWGNPD